MMVMTLWNVCRFQSNGYEISTKYPSVGLAAQLKNILIQSSYKLPGANLFNPYLPCLSLPHRP